MMIASRANGVRDEGRAGRAKWYVRERGKAGRAIVGRMKV
jgi:hypothetical protein